MPLAWCNGVENGMSCPNSSREWRTAPHCPMCGVYLRKIKRPSKRRPGPPDLSLGGADERAAHCCHVKFLGNLLRGSMFKGAHDNYEKSIETIRQQAGC